MPVAVRAVGSFASGLNAVTANAPASRVAGDFLVLFIETANEAVAAVTGWNEATNSPQGTGTAAGTASTRLTVRWRWADGTTADNAALTDSGDHQGAVIIAFSGVDPTTPFDVNPVGDVLATAGTALTFPSITTATANAMIVMAVANATDSATAQGPASITNANLTSITARIGTTGGTTANTTSGNGGGLSIYTGLKATAGATGTTTGTLVTSSVQGRMTIALREQVSQTYNLTVTETGSAGDSNSGPKTVNESNSAQGNERAWATDRPSLGGDDYEYLGMVSLVSIGGGQYQASISANAGDTLLLGTAVWAGNSGGAAAGVSDNLGESWAQVANGVSGADHAFIFKCDVAQTGSRTITLAYTLSGSMGAAVYRYKGLRAGAVQAVSAFKNVNPNDDTDNGGPVSVRLTFGSVTPTSVPAMVFAFSGQQTTYNAGANTGRDEYTAREQPKSVDATVTAVGVVIDKRVSSTSIEWPNATIWDVYQAYPRVAIVIGIKQTYDVGITESVTAADSISETLIPGAGGTTYNESVSEAASSAESASSAIFKAESLSESASASDSASAANSIPTQGVTEAVTASDLAHRYKTQSRFAFVNSTDFGDTNSGSSIAAPTIAVTAGNLLEVVASWEGSNGGTVTVADTAGNTWQAQPTRTSGSQWIKRFYVLASNANAANVVTVSFTTSVSFRGITVVQHSYSGTLSVVDSGSGSADPQPLNITIDPAGDRNALVSVGVKAYNGGEFYPAAPDFWKNRSSGAYNYLRSYHAFDDDGSAQPFNLTHQQPGTILTADWIAYNTTILESVTEPGSASDTITNALIPGGTTYNESASEAGSSADSPTATATKPNAVTETASSTETLTSANTSSRLVTEAGAAADSPSAVEINPVSVTEATTAADLASAVEINSETVTEAATSADSPAGVATKPNSTTETGTSADSISLTFVASSSSIEAGTANDSLATAATFNSTLTETGAAAEAPSNSLVGQITAVVAPATISLTGTATGAVQNNATVTATVSLSGTVTGAVQNNAVIAPASTSLTGTATGAVRVAGAVTATVGLTGTIAGAVQNNGTVSATVSLTGSAAGAVQNNAVVAPASTAVTGSATGAVRVAGSATATVSLTGTVTADLGRQAQVSATVGLTGTSTGTVKVTGSIPASTISLTGVITASSQPVTIGAIGPATVSLTGSASGNVNVAANVTATVGLTGSASGSVAIVGSSATTLVTTGTASGAVKVVGSASGSIGVTGSATVAIRVAGQLSSTLTINGQAVARLTIEGPPERRYLKMQPSIEMRTLKLSSTETVGVILVASSSPWQGVAGATNIVVKISKAGGALQTVTPTVADIGSGVYLITLTPAMLDTEGELIVYVSADGVIPVSQLYKVEKSVEDRVWGHSLALTVKKFLGLK